MAKAAHFGHINLKELYAEKIRLDCDDLSAFITALQEGLEGQLHGVHAALQQYANEYDEDVDHLIDAHVDEADALVNRFPPLLWQSVFIAIYSLFEQEMNDLCVRVRDVAQQRGVAQLPEQHIFGVDLPAQKCLCRFNIRLAVRSPEWTRFKGYKLLRHAIAHNHGRLRNDDQGASNRRFARYHTHIRVNGNQLVLEREFCERALQDMRVLLTKTVHAIPARLFSM